MTFDMASRFHLLRRAFAKSTRQQYGRDLHRFLKWSRFSAEELARLADPRHGDISVVDELVCEYMHMLYDQTHGRSGFSAASNALYGLIGLICPKAKGRLPLSSRALLGWSKAAKASKGVGKQRPPLTRFGVFAAAEWLWKNNRIAAGVAVLAAFGAYLRIDEVFRLRIRHVLLDNTCGEDTNLAGFRIKKAKTGREQFAGIQDFRIAHIIRRYLKHVRKCLKHSEGHTPDDRKVGRLKLFQLSKKDMRQALREAVQAIGITNRGLVFHSLRHGAATQDTIDGVPITEVMRRGRWVSSKSAQNYIKQCKTMGLKQVLPDAVIRRGKQLHSTERALYSSFREAVRAAESSF